MTLAQKIRLRVYLAQWRTVVFVAGVAAVVLFFVGACVALALSTDPAATGAGP